MDRWMSGWMDGWMNGTKMKEGCREVGASQHVVCQLHFLPTNQKRDTPV